jgi:hypothetical protein
LVISATYKISTINTSKCFSPTSLFFIRSKPTHSTLNSL